MSSLRPLDLVAKAELFFKRCERECCRRAFLYCHSREPGRLYCLECSPIAKKEREQKARKKYRQSPEGREQHCDEEDRRRQFGRVGDRRCAPEQGQVQLCATTAGYEVAVEEKSDARPELEWVLVAWPGLLAIAEQMLGAQVRCPCCGRQGRVTEVLELDEWHRRREESS